MKMFEVGNTYTARNCTKYECIAVKDAHAWMKGGDKQTAYVWTLDGNSVSLGHEYDITFDTRDQQITDLKTRVATLTALLQDAQC